MAHNDRLIDTLGVSRRLGRSVLSELDSRANEKAAQLDTVLDDVDQLTENTSHRFNSLHQTRFNAMDSIESHYAAKKSFHFENDGFNDGSTSRSSRTSQQSDSNSNDEPSTPKRHANEDITSSTKRYKDSQRRARKSDAFLYSPVTDITKKIRRLRMISQAPRENQSKMNAIRNTPLTRHDPSYLSATGYIPSDFNKSQPTFAKPTFTSIKRESKPGAIFSNLKKKGSIPRTHIKSVGTKPPAPLKTTSTISKVEGPPSDRPALTSSTSVFERLYQQSTISRSNSSNKLPPVKRSLPKSQTMKNVRSSAIMEATPAATSSLPRSKSSANLSLQSQSDTLSAKSGGGRRNWR